MEGWPDFYHEAVSLIIFSAFSASLGGVLLGKTVSLIPVGRTWRVALKSNEVTNPMFLTRIIDTPGVQAAKAQAPRSRSNIHTFYSISIRLRTKIRIRISGSSGSHIGKVSTGGGNREQGQLQQRVG